MVVLMDIISQSVALYEKILVFRYNIVLFHIHVKYHVCTVSAKALCFVSFMFHSLFHLGTSCYHDISGMA